VAGLRLAWLRPGLLGCNEGELQTPLFSALLTKLDDLPSQARDKRKEISKKGRIYVCIQGTKGELINRDYGEPLGVCFEEGGKGHGSGVFVREWSKATVRMDCETFLPTIAMKKT
jgi:hypothetical protein